ncbi:uncharacterized protein IWZ02DRAFT_436278 [Phyllosticta citriasiana]|uniref:uncharacterized protein n=1 Tax=Phyllosticta citriasiana TaxID=595635 RepID=UPI0030FDDE8B
MRTARHQSPRSRVVRRRRRRRRRHVVHYNGVAQEQSKESVPIISRRFSRLPFFRIFGFPFLKPESPDLPQTALQNAYVAPHSVKIHCTYGKPNLAAINLSNRLPQRVQGFGLFYFILFFFGKSANPPAIQAQPVVRPPTGTLTTQWLSTRLHPSTALMEPRAHTLTKLQQPTRARQHTRAQSQAQLSSSGHPQKAKPRANEASHITNQARPISSRHAADRPLALRHANGAAKLRQPRFPTA